MLKVALIPKTVIFSISAQLQGITGRVDELIISVSAILMLILWIPVAVSFFSVDENKRVEARLRLKNAIIGTFIYALAVSGVIYTVFVYIASGG